MSELLYLWHPESPGMRVAVRRNVLEKLARPREFATLAESLAFSRACELADFAHNAEMNLRAATKEKTS